MMAGNIGRVGDSDRNTSKAPAYSKLNHSFYQVNQILDEGTHSTNNYSSFTPLYVAASTRNNALVNVLLFKGADVNKPSKGGETPLYIACKAGHLDVVKTLINNGADINLCTDCKDTCLNVACWHGRCEIVKLLLEKGADKSQFSEPRTARNRNRHDELVNNLESRLNVGWVNSEGEFPRYTLKSACALGNKDIINIMLDFGVDINGPCRCGWSPLYFACVYKHFSTADFLLKRGANAFIRKVPGCLEPSVTPLYIVSKEGLTELVKLMLKNRAEVDRPNTPMNGETPLSIACIKGHYDIVQILLNSGADVNLSIKPIVGQFYTRSWKHRDIFQCDKLYNLILDLYVKGLFVVFIKLLDKMINSNCDFCRLDSFVIKCSCKEYEGVIDACVQKWPEQITPLVKQNCIMIGKLIKKLQVAGLFDSVVSVDQETLNSCCDEIKNMKVLKVLNSVPLYIVIQRNNAPYYLRNQDLLNGLEKYLNSEEAEEQFPLYGKILRNRLLGSKYRLSLLTKASEALEGQRWNMLPLAIQENILSYLDNRDLERCALLFHPLFTLYPHK